MSEFNLSVIIDSLAWDIYDEIGDATASALSSLGFMRFDHEFMRTFNETLSRQMRYPSSVISSDYNMS